MLIFTYYKDTARYLYRNLCAQDEEGKNWRTSAGEPTIRRMDSGTEVKERAKVVSHFAPIINKATLRRNRTAASAFSLDERILN
ncbi:hypothetical protein KDH_67580 [Dictyobacter sp. S3.2.2.5]|uniref:Uncharacterized protein n=1 Tax=Dictyobacter halimunensis TaxID=3026934 RepID=A0ABQ6G0C8_9CHLR|nr:hypothetical protein KDH_67580 [Dictyobacter sp. S3.2.2.5]